MVQVLNDLKAYKIYLFETDYCRHRSGTLDHTLLNKKLESDDEWKDTHLIDNKHKER